MIMCILLFSCKKDMNLNQGNTPSSQADKFAVTFNVSDFSPQVVGADKGNSISDVPLKGRAGYFTYIAYNSEGKEVNRLKQDSTGLTLLYRKFLDQGDLYQGYPLGIQPFGCIKDSLAAGEYTIVMIASQSNFSINNRNELVLDYTFSPFTEASFYYNRGLDSWSRAKDTFYKKFSLTVEEKDSQHKVTLDRIVGKAEINILDSRPGTTFKFFFIGENEAFKFSDEQPFSEVDEINAEVHLPTIPGKEKLSYSKFIINTATPVDVIINVYENGALTATKTIKDVRFFKNKRTVLTGNIYAASPPTTGFNVQVNDKFDEDTVVVKF